MVSNIIQGLRAHGDALAARLDREDGVTAIEYGLIAALIAVFIIFALQLVGDGLVDIFTRIANELTGAGSP